MARARVSDNGVPDTDFLAARFIDGVLKQFDLGWRQHRFPVGSGAGLGYPTVLIRHQADLI
jgi:hypothetical protein